MAREAALEPRASVAATRAINIFATRWSGDSGNIREPRLFILCKNRVEAKGPFVSVCQGK